MPCCDSGGRGGGVRGSGQTVRDRRTLFSQSLTNSLDWMQAESKEESEEVAKLKVALMKIQGGLESANDARDSV